MIQAHNDSSRRVAYFYNYQIGSFQYGKEHPMKPKRIAMAHNLIVNYGLYKMLDVYLTREAQLEEIRKFHDEEYIKYLSQFMCPQKTSFIKEYCTNASDTTVIPQNLIEELKLIEKWSKTNSKQVNSEFRVGDSPDNPTFQGLFTFCQLSAGGSIDCAHAILAGEASIAINWAGGLHHAKKKEASGFCYINDIVVCILELLRIYTRVLYVDIDCHHGDGVEEAFFLSNRVMTVSFHQYGDDFYPGSGHIDSIGAGIGKYYAVNVPMRPGMSDEPYYEVFKKVSSRVMETFRPDCIVMQCGADSLSLDKLGGFNLSIKGHGACVDYMKGFGLPMIFLGGGGYTIQNVSRCWAYETGICLGVQIDEPIPCQDKYYELYQPDYKLHYNIRGNVENKNKDDDLNKTIASVYEHLRYIEQAPGISFHDVPYSFYPKMENEDEDDVDRDQKREQSLRQFDDSQMSQAGFELNLNMNERKIHSRND